MARISKLYGIGIGAALVGSVLFGVVRSYRTNEQKTPVQQEQAKYPITLTYQEAVAKIDSTFEDSKKKLDSIEALIQEEKAKLQSRSESK